jgi:hypothetical protein
VKVYRWDTNKNVHLQKERAISFEEIVEAISEGGLLDTLEHPNQEKYGGQKLLVVRWKEYIYLVPTVETEQEVFLKTIIPSRKYLKKYGGSHEDTVAKRRKRNTEGL